jgi:hypothetical protein
MEQALADYIWNYHRSLAKEVEAKAWRHLGTTEKMDVDARRHAKIQLMKHGLLTEDEDALALVALGFPELKRRVVESIWAQHGQELAINRCPKCNGVCRTPEAKQCRCCHHDWH